MMWAYFVLAHDCGHGSFSTHELLNDCIGTVMHSFILAPYFPWKLSHRHHHMNTGNMDKEEVFHPVRQADWDIKTPGTKRMLTDVYLGLGFGWFIYLVTGYDGPLFVVTVVVSSPLLMSVLGSI